MAGRKPGWLKVHERLQEIIDRLGDVKTETETAQELGHVLLWLEDLQIRLEDLDENFRPWRTDARAATAGA